MATAYDIQQAKFSVGDIVQHRLFGYRGVIVDVDASFLFSDEMYAAVKPPRQPRDKPWYHVLIDGQEHADYVAELNIVPDDNDEPVMHPMLGEFFSSYENGHYVLGGRPN